jgi:hypothetical protein
MISVTPRNTEQYLETEAVDAIFDFINQQLAENPETITRTGVGCFCSPDFITKIGLKNIYVEYNYEVIGSMHKHPFQFKIHPHEIIIFDIYPNQIILEKIEKVKKLIIDYSSLN